MAIQMQSRTEAFERQQFEQCWMMWKPTREFGGYHHPELGIWFYDDDAVNMAWQAWRERAHMAGSFSVMPGMDPAYKALQDALAACKESGRVQECINAIQRLLDVQAKC